MSTAKVVRVLWPWSEASITLAPRKKRGADVAENGKALPPPPRMTERSEESAFLSPLCPTSLSVSHFRNSVNVTDDDVVQTLSDNPYRRRHNFTDMCENKTLRDGRKRLPTVLGGLSETSKQKSLNEAGEKMMTSGQVDPHYPFHSRLLTTAEFGSSLLLQGATTKEALSASISPPPLLSFLLRQQREQNRTTSGSVFNEEGEEGEGSHATDRPLTSGQNSYRSDF